MIKQALMGGAATAALTLSLAGSAFAGYDVNSRIDSLENELRELRAQMQARDSKLAELEEATTGLGDMPVFDSKKLMISSRDGNWSIRFGGRLQLDAFLADAERAGGVETSGGGAEVRRARFFAEGLVAGDWEYKLEVSFDGTSASFETATIGTNVGGFDLTFGNDKEPMGLEELTSSRYITFMERSLVNEAFAPGRNLGANVSRGGDNYSASVGFYTNGIDNGSDTATTDWATTGRVTFAPIAEKDQVVHLGVSASYRGFDDNSGPRIRLRNFHNGTRYVDSGTFAAEGQTTIGLEAAAVLGPVSLQGEYYDSSIEGNGATVDTDYDGWYLMASYFVTGESRAYKANSGKFDRVKSDGAIELAARYEQLDMEDVGFGAGASDNSAWTLGVNYYFNPYIRTMLNYGSAEYDFTTASGSADTDVDFIGTRLQVDF
ncbi:MAG: porin [Parvibaculum sp.]